MAATQTTTREAVEDIARFLAANPDGATGPERDAIAALDADRDAAIERGIKALEQPTVEATETGTVETFTFFTAAELAAAGAKRRNLPIGERRNFWTNGESSIWTRLIGGRLLHFYATEAFIQVSTTYNGHASNEIHSFPR